MSREHALRPMATPENKPLKPLEKKSLGPSVESIISAKKLSGEVGALTTKINDLEGDLKLYKFSKNNEGAAQLISEIERLQTTLSTKLYELDSTLSDIDHAYAEAGVEPTDPKRMEYGAQKDRSSFLLKKLHTDRDSARIHKALKLPELSSQTATENTDGVYERYSPTLGRTIKVGGKNSEHITQEEVGVSQNVNMTAAEINRLADENERIANEELAAETAELRSEVQSADDGTQISKLKRKYRTSPSGALLPQTGSQEEYNIDPSGDVETAEWLAMTRDAKQESLRERPQTYEEKLDEMLTAKKPSGIRNFISSISSMFKRKPKLEAYDEDQPPEIPTPDHGALTTHTEITKTMSGERIVRVPRSSQAYTNRETGGVAEFPHEAIAAKIKAAADKQAARLQEEEGLEELPASAITPELPESSELLDASHFEQLSTDLDTVQQEIENGQIDSFDSLENRLSTLSLRDRMNELLPPKAHNASLEMLMGKRILGLFGKPTFDKKTAAAYLQKMAGDALNRSNGII